MERRIQGKPQALQAILDATNGLPEPKRQDALRAISANLRGSASSISEVQRATAEVFNSPMSPPLNVMPDKNNADNQ